MAKIKGTQAPFQAGIPPDAIPEQLKNLAAKLDAFGGIKQLEAGASVADVGNKVNELIVALQAIRLNYQPNAKKL